MGYSAFSAINSSFVVDAVNNAEDEDIARAVIALGHGLHLQVIAMGIESKDQQNRLSNLGCDEGQGYLYGYTVLPWSEVFQKMMKD